MRAAEVAGWLAKAEAADAADDAAHGLERRGDERPDWVADKPERLAKIRAAKAALEAAARAAPAPAAEPGPSTGMTDHGRPARAADGGPPQRAQRNFTDPDSRVLKTREGLVQGDNGQLAVDAAHQIITAQRLTTNGSDQDGLAPLLDATMVALGRKPRAVSAAAGFGREANLAALAARRIGGFSPPAAPPTAAPTRAAAAGSSSARGWPRWRPSSSAPAGARATACASRRSRR